MLTILSLEPWSIPVKRFYEACSPDRKNIWGRSDVRKERLTLSDSEDRGSAVGACALDRSLSVLERDVLRVLDLNVRFAFDAICLWHFYSAERALERGSI